MGKVLECSSKGDKRFSAFSARVKFFGKVRSIENHYQTAKRFGEGGLPKTWKDAKGKDPIYISLAGYDFPPELLSAWYKLLWLRYLDKHPDLVEYASEFDEFNDIFRGKSQNCQADVIEQYVKKGRGSIIEDCFMLMGLLTIVSEEFKESEEGKEWMAKN